MITYLLLASFPVLNIYMIVRLFDCLLFSVINLKLYYISYFRTLDRNP